ncbi:MAG TPA: NUDIX domain-containing protein [Spongiibacteraceae bacterium]|nr:NUDIX domain-containing protein [Spongiibacteraceae bacterium]
MRHRVFTYITQGPKLLVLDYVDGSYVEPQIPGGTIEPGESPAQAALREAREETGLSGLKVVSFLGSFISDLRAIGRNETIKAWFFHLEAAGPTPQRWRHAESDPHDGSAPVYIELYWVPMESIPKLGGIDCTMLPELAESVANYAARNGA